MHAALHYTVSNCGPRELHANDQNAALVEFPVQVFGVNNMWEQASLPQFQIAGPVGARPSLL